MANRKIIIIGATSGIGRQLATLYAAEGNVVGATGRRGHLLEEIKNEYPDCIHTACFDVTAGNNVAELEKIIREMGDVDLLIYNSGFGDVSKELNPELERITTQTNVNGFIEIVSFAFNYFVKKGKGQIAVISSIAALRGNSWAPSYSASKSFISNYAEGLNIKARRMKKDIIVTDIKPGFVDTKLSKGNGRFWISSPEKAGRQIKSAIDKKRRVAYITKRWWLIAQMLKLMPYSLYRRLV